MKNNEYVREDGKPIWWKDENWVLEDGVTPLTEINVGMDVPHPFENDPKMVKDVYRLVTYVFQNYGVGKCYDPTFMEEALNISRWFYYKHNKNDSN